MALTLTADALKPGDTLIPTGRTVLRVVRDGLYERTPADVWYSDKRRFPARKVEIVLDDGQGVRYWWKTTRVQVERPA